MGDTEDSKLATEILREIADEYGESTLTRARNGDHEAATEVLADALHEMEESEKLSESMLFLMEGLQRFITGDLKSLDHALNTAPPPNPGGRPRKVDPLKIALADLAKRQDGTFSSKKHANRVLAKAYGVSESTIRRARADYDSFLSNYSLTDPEDRATLREYLRQNQFEPSES